MNDAARIRDLETALTAATEAAWRLANRLEEAEAERDARPAVRWEVSRRGETLYWETVNVGLVAQAAKGYWVATAAGRLIGRLPTPEAAKAAVEAALRKVDEKEGA